MRQIEEEMIRKAKEASENAYAPFSKFNVGAAVLTTTGEILVGCNVENSSYGLSICAERNAIFHAVTRLGPNVRISKVAVYTPTDEKTLPCGACLQVMTEFAKDLQVIISSKSLEPETIHLEKLMPQPFRL